MQRLSAGGVGLLVSAGAPGFVGIDVDNVLQDGKLHPLGVEVVERFKCSYIEVSPSGTGLRVFALGNLPADCPKGSTAVGVGANGKAIKFEVYAAGGAGRFLRCTGVVLKGTAGNVTSCPEAIEWFAGKMRVASGSGTRFPDNVSRRENGLALSVVEVFTQLAELRPVLDADQVLAAIRTEASSKPRGKIAEALRGGLAPWKGDHSSADLFLCCEAVRRGCGSAEDVEAVWRETSLARRDKFKKRRDYRASTIERAARSVQSTLAARSGALVAGGCPALPVDLQAALDASGDILTRTRGGHIAPDAGNVVVLFRRDPRLVKMLGFNELEQRIERLGSWKLFDVDAEQEPGPLVDTDLTRLGMWLAREYGMRVEPSELMRGVEAAAHARAFDPLKARLLQLRDQWDGEPRLSTALRDLALVEDGESPEYVSAVSQMFFIGAVARALDPGCKHDTVLALEGKGGGGKSAFLQTLANAVLPGLFTDSIGDLSNEQSVVEGTGGRWLVEVPELAAVRRAADVEALKASITRRSDTVRRPYARMPVSIPRRFVLAATTNKTGGYLVDASGALLRRFWPLRTSASETHPINLDAVAAVAPQLWGEAVHLYEAGARWWLEQQDGAAFRQWTANRENRQESGVFDDALVTFLAEWVDGYMVDGKGMSLRDIAQKIADFKAAEGDSAAGGRLADRLRALGLEPRKDSAGRSRWHFSGGALRDFAERRERMRSNAFG